MSAAPPEVPRLPSHLKFVEVLAKTTYGFVVEAVNRDKNAAVAVKLLKTDGSHGDIPRLMFRRETEALTGLKHEGIVEIFGSFEDDDGVLGIELELVPQGLTLQKLLSEVGLGRLPPPSIDWRLRMATRLASAVSEAHRRTVIHRDLKPGNVLWNRDEESLKLADFGIAAVFPLTAREAGGATLRNFFSKPFASPEQIRQEAPSSESDVFGFALLVGVLLALKGVGEEFHRDEIPQLLSVAISEMQAGGAVAADTARLQELLSSSLAERREERPSMAELSAAIGRIQRALTPRAEAHLVLARTPKEKLLRLGFNADGNVARILDDLNCDLRVVLERDRSKGEVLKLFGRSLFLVGVVNASNPDRPVIQVLDAGQNPGPIHEWDRSKASPCDVLLRFGNSGGAALINHARDLDRSATRKATSDLVSRSRLIIEVERERLPLFQIEADVQGGRDVRDREARIAEASGYEGAAAPRVRVEGGFLLHVKAAQRALPPSKKSAAGTSATGATGASRAFSLDGGFRDEWADLFDDPRDVAVLDHQRRMVGKVTRFDRKASLVHVQTDRGQRLLKSGIFFLKNSAKEFQLKAQQTALDSLERGETLRADLPVLLAEAAAHRMGKRSWCQLLQPNLVPKDRVQELVDRILASETVFCLQGPPGTGKTTIIAEVVAQVLERNPRSRILVSSQANDAVANALERICKTRDQLRREWIVVRDVSKERALEEGGQVGFEIAYQEFAGRVKKSIGQLDTSLQRARRSKNG